jgi:hypothetical protein
MWNEGRTRFHVKKKTKGTRPTGAPPSPKGKGLRNQFHNDLTKIIEFAVDSNPPTLSAVVDKLCELRESVK